MLAVGIDRANRVRNAPTAAGPTPAAAPEFRDFRRLAGLLRELQQADMLHLTADAQGAIVVLARPAGPPPTAAEAAVLAEAQALLGLATTVDRYRVTSDPLALDGEHLALQPRSVMSVLFFLSQGVDVPAGDAAAGLVTTTRNPDGTPFDWQGPLGGLFRVHVADDEPARAAVKVAYRGRWFYLRDDDLEAKSTFLLLGQLLGLQAGGAGGAAAPLLTLPAGR